MPRTMDRRDFIRLCAAAGAAHALPSAGQTVRPRSYGVKPSPRPAKPCDPGAHARPQLHLHYPYRATPCFLDLGRPTATDIALRTKPARSTAGRAGRAAALHRGLPGPVPTA